MGGEFLPPIVATLRGDISGFSRSMAAARGEMAATSASSSAMGKMSSLGGTAIKDIGILPVLGSVARLHLGGDFTGERR